jgi:hypothetical protein
LTYKKYLIITAPPRSGTLELKAGNELYGHSSPRLQRDVEDIWWSADSDLEGSLGRKTAG